MRVSINDSWFLDADDISVKLVEMVIRGAGPKTKEENVGTAREVSRGYYATVRDALRRYMEISVRRDLEATDLRGLLAAMDERVIVIEEMAKRIAPNCDAPCKKPSSSIPLTLPSFRLSWTDLAPEARKRLLSEAKVTGNDAADEPEELDAAEMEALSQDEQTYMRAPLPPPPAVHEVASKPVAPAPVPAPVTHAIPPVTKKKRFV